jgi:hypothetical protein
MRSWEIPRYCRQIRPFDCSHAYVILKGGVAVAVIAQKGGSESDSKRLGVGLLKMYLETFT